MIFLQIALIIVCLMLSASFSGFETALFTLPRIKLQSYLLEKRRHADILNSFLSRPRRILVTLLGGNLLVNVTASSVLTLLVITLAHQYRLNETLTLFIEFFAMSYILLLVGEITPKALAMKHYEFIAFNLAPLMKSIHFLFAPISNAFDYATGKILPRTEVKKVSARELNIMLQEAKTAGIIEEAELGIARQLLGLGKRTVAQAMTPVNSAVGLSDSTSVSEAKKLIRKAKHSRLVVFEGETKAVTGIIYANDIVFAGDDLPIKNFMREPHFIPENKNLEALLTEFRKQGMHIAVVTDEFGEFVGLITLEDILESLVGEIIDEYDGTEDIPYQRMDSEAIVFDGSVTLHSVFHAFNLEYVEESETRLSAFILRALGHIPREGESTSHHGLLFVIKETKGRQIKKILVKRQ